jgi:hypothetical protein
MKIVLSDQQNIVVTLGDRTYRGVLHYRPEPARWYIKILNPEPGEPEEINLFPQ